MLVCTAAALVRVFGLVAFWLLLAWSQFRSTTNSKLLLLLLRAPLPLPSACLLALTRSLVRSHSHSPKTLVRSRARLSAAAAPALLGLWERERTSSSSKIAFLCSRLARSCAHARLPPPHFASRLLSPRAKFVYLCACRHYNAPARVHHFVQTIAFHRDASWAKTLQAHTHMCVRCANGAQEQHTMRLALLAHTLAIVPL